MMDIKISPRKLGGAFCALPSKSEAHRALILAALARSPTRIDGVGETGLSDDILRTLGAIRALGAKATEGGDHILVEPPEKYADGAVVDCGESGSTLRFMIPVCAALGGAFRFIRRGRLPERPIAALGTCLEGHGVTFEEDGGDLLVSGKLTPGAFSIPGSESSQYITGMLFALSVCGGSLRITGALESAPYVDMTLDIMNSFGVPVFCVDRGGELTFSVAAGQTLPHRSDVRPVAVGGDWSGAANFIVCGASALGLDPDSAQGDRAILDILADMGALTSSVGGALCASFDGKKPRAIETDMRDTPDIIPLVAVLCCAAEGKSTIRGTRRLRIKESDRVESTLSLIRALGGEASATEDEICVSGGALHGGEVDSCGDHRIAMAAAVASTLASGDIILRGAECVAKSYPTFWEVFRSLGGSFTEI